MNFRSVNLSQFAQLSTLNQTSIVKQCYSDKEKTALEFGSLDEGRERKECRRKRKAKQQVGLFPQRARIDSKKIYTVGTRPHACTRPKLSVFTPVSK